MLIVLDFHFMDKKYYQKIKPKIPPISGVYSFNGSKGEILYIGKARNLVNRVGSYFGHQTRPMILKMLSLARTLTWQETASEIEALILESSLIKKHHPRFNTMLRDDKQYFYVSLSDDKFPKLSVGHQPGDDSKKVIGPFTDGSALELTLKELRKIFPYCTCKQKHNRFCLNYHIGNCLGFCCLKNAVGHAAATEYQANIKAVSDILSGKRRLIIRKMIKNLAVLAAKNDFDKADKLKIKVRKLRQIFENASIIRRLSEKREALKQLKDFFGLPESPIRIEGYDISNIQGSFAVGSMAVFVNGQPDKSQYRKFKIKTVIGANDTAMLAEVLTRRLGHPEWSMPQLFVIDGGKGQLNTAISVIGKGIPIISVAKDDRHHGESVFSWSDKKPVKLTSLPQAARNLILAIDAEAHRFAISYYRKKHGFEFGR